PFLKEVDDLRKEGFENRRLLDSPEGYIPGRNLIFYGLAGHYAELDAVRYIVGGHNGIDPESFPDASPKFFNFLNSVFHLSLWSYDASPVQILVPLSGKSKDDVIRMGLDMKVPFDVTWSCYWDRDARAHHWKGRVFHHASSRMGSPAGRDRGPRDRDPGRQEDPSATRRRVPRTIERDAPVPAAGKRPSPLPHRDTALRAAGQPLWRSCLSSRADETRSHGIHRLRASPP